MPFDLLIRRMKKRIFITGGTGFFGKSMLDYRLRHPDWEWAQAEWTILSRSPEKFVVANPSLTQQKGVSFVAGDVRDFSLQGSSFDAIIHAATSAVNTLTDDEMTSVILDGTKHVVDFAKNTGCGTILLTSSGAVYGPRTEVAKETDVCNPVTAYGKGKLAAERLLIDLGLNVKIARCFAFVGPYLDRSIQYAIGNFIGNCLAGGDIVIKGDGAPLRSYLYADDLVEWLFAILDRGESGRPYNVGSDQPISIRELALTIRNTLGASSEIKVLGKSVAGAANVYVPNVDRITRELGVEIKNDLSTAILKSVKR